MVSFTAQTSFVLLLLLFVAAFNRSICSKNRVVRCNEKDRETLLMFKQGVVDPSNSLSSWSSEEDCCAWVGVYCDNITGRVTELDLANYGSHLQGEINLSLLQLEYLHYLDLSGNDFEAASIPPTQVSESASDKHRSYHNQSLATPSYQPANFSNLHYLDLSYNNYLHINDLYWLSQLSSLKYLDLSLIDIGNETKWLQYMAMLPSLSELHLSSCQLTNISPSLNFVNSTSLVTLDLSWNNFEMQLSNLMFYITRDISYLDLSESKLKGQIPPTLSRFRNLKLLNLAGNELIGSIPDWLSQLEHLQFFDIHANAFYGSFPSTLGNLSSLIELDLSFNHLSGNLPKSLGQLYHLQSLSVEDNSLEGVLSETNFAKLSNLESLSLSSNGFKSHFDPNWVPLFQLREFDSSNSSLGPNFTAWLYTQRLLDYLDISSSGMSFVADDMFWSFIVRIRWVELSNNSIIGDLSNVTINSSYVYLDNNNFTGGLPHILGNVQEFRESHNSFSGPLFPLLCHPGSGGENMLFGLDISYNHLSGSLPDCWANWKQLEYLHLGSNKLTGEVPPSMSTLSKLSDLDLHNNNFFGKFSLDSSNLTNLQYLNLEKNKFSGCLPNMTKKDFGQINLGSNQFTGNIPPQICNFHSLMVLNLAENMLSGSVPRCVYNIMDSKYEPGGIYWDQNIDIITKGQKLEYRFVRGLRSFDLSANNLSGENPRELFGITQMISLNLSHNQLTRKIPKEIGGMKNLESLDLSHNKLSGEIPQAISNLSFLACLNLSYNSFTGQIPLGTQIQTFEAWSFIGNAKLCGAPLPTNCTKQQETEKPKAAEENEDDGFLKSLYLGMGGGFAVGFWGVSGSLFIIRAWRHRFFQLVYRLEDRLYVAVALKWRTNCS